MFPRSHPSAETLVKLGAAALALGPIAGVPAIVLGRVALREIAESSGRYTGEVRVRLGLSLGWAGTEVHGLLLLYLIGASSEVFALVVLAAGVLSALTIAVGVSAVKAPWHFATAGALARRTPQVVYPAVIGLVAVGVAGFVSKRSADEHARMQALAVCEQARLDAGAALARESFDVARAQLQTARGACFEVTLQDVARAEADVDAQERAAIEQRAREEAAREATRRAEEDQQREERDRQAAVRFTRGADAIRRQIKLASTRTAQQQWGGADAALKEAEAGLQDVRDTAVARDARYAAYLAESERLRTKIDASIEQAQKAREAQEARRQAAREAQEARRQAAREAQEARRQAAREVAVEAERGSQNVMCCDGTRSPSCGCSRSSFRGCCSHHGGVCGGCD